MLTKPMDVLTQFPVRKNKKQKQAFRDAVTAWAKDYGYEAKEEKCDFGGRNLVLGDAEKAKFVIGAHYDTCARLPFPNLITPCSFWGFVGYQILITLVILLPAVFLAAGVYLLTDSSQLCRLVFLLLLWADIFLMILGPANPNNANDNTSGVVTVLEILRTLDPALREKVCFVLFDLEEAGLIGSAAYRKAHKKASDNQIVLNLDCVGEGDEILLFPTKKLLKNKPRLGPLYNICGYFGSKSLLIRDKGFSIYPSDQANFPYGVGIAALKRKKKLLYLDRIHTVKDTCLDETNVNILRSALTTLVSRSAV